MSEEQSGMLDGKDPQRNRPGANTVWRRRALMLALYGLVFLAVLALSITLFNAAMWVRAAREARRIAETDDGAAFETTDYQGEGNSGVLLFHGIHGTPDNFLLLLAELRRRGIDYHAPMLGGDRPGPATGLGMTDAHLAMHAERAYSVLSRRCDRIVVVGHSLGAVQATDVASRQPVAGLVLISPAYRVTQRWYLPPSMEAWTRTLAPVLPLLPKFSPARINDPEGLAMYAGLRTFPLSTVNALIDYSPDVLDRANTVRAPVLALLCRNDEVVDVPSAEAGVQSLASAEKRVVWYERSNHTPFLDYDREDAVRNIVDFIVERLSAEPFAHEQEQME